MYDNMLMISILQILVELDGNSIEEYTLMNEIDLRVARPVTSTAVREHLQEAERRLWAVRELGTLNGETRWRHGDQAAAALLSMRRR